MLSLLNFKGQARLVLSLMTCSKTLLLAVRAKVPIFVEDSVLERAGVALETTEESITSTSDSQIEQDDENLDAYRDFINSLDALDEFGKD